MNEARLERAASRFEDIFTEMDVMLGDAVRQEDEERVNAIVMEIAREHNMAADAADELDISIESNISYEEWAERLDARHEIRTMAQGPFETLFSGVDIFVDTILHAEPSTYEIAVTVGGDVDEKRERYPLPSYAAELFEQHYSPEDVKDSLLRGQDDAFNIDAKDAAVRAGWGQHVQFEDIPKDAISFDVRLNVDADTYVDHAYEEFEQSGGVTRYMKDLLTDDLVMNGYVEWDEIQVEPPAESDLDEYDDYEDEDY